MYAKNITKDYLETLGIESVSTDGKKIVCKGKELEQRLCKSNGYLNVDVYDPDIYKALYPITHCRSAGMLHIGVHRIV